MGKPYSMDLRERLVAYLEAGHSCRAAARVFRVSASTAVRLAAAQRERGDIAPRPQGRMLGTVGKLAAHQAFLLEIPGCHASDHELAGIRLEIHLDALPCSPSCRASALIRPPMRESEFHSSSLRL